VTIATELRSKVVQMHLAGHGRNEIARLLSQQGLHVSEGSVGNIVRAYRSSRNEQPLQSDTSENEQVNTNTTIHRHGGPLSNFLSEDAHNQMNNSEQTDPTNQELEEIESVDFSDSPMNLEIFNNPDFPYDPRLDGPAAENLLAYSNQYPNNQQIPESRRLEIPEPITIIKETEEVEEASGEPNQPQPPIRNSENQSTLAGIDWDERWEDRFWARIMEEKEEKRHQLMLIEEQKELMLIERHNLDQVSQNIDQRENDLRMREARIKEVEPLLPSVRELQRMNVTFQIILPYIMAINEKAVAENIDLTTSAYNLVQDIHQYRELGTLQSTVKDLEERVSALNELNTQKQAAVITFMDLQLMGYSNKEITELVETVSRWKGGPGLGQANGHKLDTELIGIGTKS
jgi:hypothetical protein